MGPLSWVAPACALADKAPSALAASFPEEAPLALAAYIACSPTLGRTVSSRFKNTRAGPNKKTASPNSPIATAASKIKKGRVLRSSHLSALAGFTAGVSAA